MIVKKTDVLPIGTLVLLKGTDKDLMITESYISDKKIKPGRRALYMGSLRRDFQHSITSTCIFTRHSSGQDITLHLLFSLPWSSSAPFSKAHMSG